MSFIIDRALIQRAGELLSNSGLVQCTSNTCRSRAPTAKNDSTLSSGLVHFHLAPNMLPNIRPSIQLHIRDERIWTVPETDSPTHTDGKNIIFASDQRFPAPNWGLSEEYRGVRGRCRHYPGSPVRILTPECYADALLLLMIRDRNTKASLNWSTQVNYMIQYGLFNPDKVHPATRDFMNFPPKVSKIDSLAQATSAVGNIANLGKLHAEWAKDGDTLEK